MVTPKKGTDKIRMSIDLSCLNRLMEQERYQSVTPAETVAEERAKIFTKIDTLKGYQQYRLDEKSQFLTIFIMPFWKLKYIPACSL